MKRTLVFLLAAAAALPAMAQSSLSTEAQRAYMSGDLQTAKQKFQMILAEDPSNVAARNYLKAIAQDEGAAGGGNKPAKQFQALIVPTVEFKEATLGSALDYLKEQGAKLSGGKLQPSFVLQPGVDRAAPVTLHLTNVPFTEVLRYMGEMANVQFSIEQYAIVVRPRR